MASSLKALFPALSPLLGLSPDALYARQRAFVAAGVLKATPGRGPGSGVRASPETLAEFLIAMATHASTEENVSLALALAKARSAHGTCPLTGARMFQDALARILAREPLARRVREISIGVTLSQAFIRYDGAPWASLPERQNADPHKSSVFVGKAAKRGGLSFTASISADILLSLAREVST